MRQHIFLTDDGSHSIALQDVEGLTYHSRFGAVRESQHIFIEQGLKPFLSASRERLSIFEMGFGTGLNALLTILAAENFPHEVYYETIEIEPLPLSIVSSLNYTGYLARPGLQEPFTRMHRASWEVPVPINQKFVLFKRRGDLRKIFLEGQFDLVYFDAFAPGAQPDLWTSAIFAKLYHVMKDEAALLTYCSKGSVRRAMQDAGFEVEKIAGPPGKREIVRAFKRQK